MGQFFVIAICLASIISSLAAPTTDEFVSEDDIAKAAIDKLIKYIGKLASEQELVVAMLRSVDQTCVLEKYKKYNRTKDLLEEDFEVETITESAIDPALIFTNIALSCSNKLNSLLGFVFDSTFAYSSLLDAFREDEPFKEYLDLLSCANHYAVEHKWIDPTIYPHFNYQLVNKTQEECDAKIQETKETVVSGLRAVSEGFIIDSRTCLESELVASAEMLFFKYVLLIPSGLTDDQKQAAKANFIHDTRGAFDSLLKCNEVVVAKEDSSVSTNEI